MFPTRFARVVWSPGLAFGFVVLLAATAGLAQRPANGPPAGKGKGTGKDASFAADRDVFHFLLENRKDIRRTVKDTKTGVETVTESDKPEVAKQIQAHVAAMHARVTSGKGLHYRDPLFAELFKHHDKIVMKVEKTAKGVSVTESSDEPYVAQLIQAHARVVSKFIENGFAEAHKNHPLPGKPEAKQP
ncbi:MAG TPA: hypothetical protein VGE74_17075 [Gemmata sp.]